jgi:hypothetical protein
MDFVIYAFRLVLLSRFNTAIGSWAALGRCTGREFVIFYRDPEICYGATSFKSAVSCYPTHLHAIYLYTLMLSLHSVHTSAGSDKHVTNFASDKRDGVVDTDQKGCRGAQQ